MHAASTRPHESGFRSLRWPYRGSAAGAAPLRRSCAGRSGGISLRFVLGRGGFFVVGSAYQRFGPALRAFHRAICTTTGRLAGAPAAAILMTVAGARLPVEMAAAGVDAARMREGRCAGHQQQRSQCGGIRVQHDGPPNLMPPCLESTGHPLISVRRCVFGWNTMNTRCFTQRQCLVAHDAAA
jgi:hypothetical protein